MSEQRILYAFSRSQRHRHPQDRAEAVTWPYPTTSALIRHTYRDLRRAGLGAGSARLHVFLLMSAPVTHLWVEQVSL